MDGIGFLNNGYNTFYLRCGYGISHHPLSSFDAALVKAGVGDYNLVKISSVMPPGCSQGNEINIAPGSAIPAAYAHQTFKVCDILDKVFYSSVSAAIPANPKESGLIMEHSDSIYKFSHPTESYKDRLIKNVEMLENGMKLRNKLVYSQRNMTISVMKNNEHWGEKPNRLTYLLFYCLETGETIEEQIDNTLPSPYITLFSCCVLGVK